MTVLIDNREGSADLCTIPPLDTVCRLTTLKSGDAVFTGQHSTGDVTIGIEVKTIADLVSSSRSGRLQDVQLSAMIPNFHSSWLIYYGIYRPQERGPGILIYNEKRERWELLQIGRKGKWRVPYSYLQSITVEMAELGVNIFHVSTKVDVAEWIYKTYLWWQKPWDQHKFMQVFLQDSSLATGLDKSRQRKRGRREDAKREDDGVLRVARVAAGLPGINFTRGVRAAKRFRSVRAMIMATEDEWKRISGIGDGIARTVCRAIWLDIDE